MNSNQKVQIPKPKVQSVRNKFSHLHLLGILLTLGGIGLFIYFISSVGVGEILEGIGRIGFAGFAIILLIYVFRISARAIAWKLSVYEPYHLSFLDTFQAVIIGEALSAMIPLGILVSGTAKAVAVRKRVPLVAGLSSVATENLFYSLGTGLFVILGAITALKSFTLPEGWVITINVLVGVILLLIALGFLMIIRQWHWASGFCEILYEREIGRTVLENGRLHARLFENLVYGFYRKYPQRFLPIFLLQVAFHTLGVMEVWFVLSRISDGNITFQASFLLESINRVILVVFKLIPFVIGVSEAGAEFITENLALGVGLGVTLAIIQKGRVLFWTAVGIVLIFTQGISLQEIFQSSESPNIPSGEYKTVVSSDKLR